MKLDSIPEPHFQKCLEAFAARNGFKKPRFEVSQATDLGDNYFGVIYRVVVSEFDRDLGKNNDQKKLKLMCKGTLQATSRRETFNLNRAFRNEANFYQLLGAYVELMQEKALLQLEDSSSYPEAPRFYSASVEGPSEADMIIMQDLSAEGFAMLSRWQGLGAVHTRAVLCALARLHAASFALETLKPQRFQQLRAKVKEVFYDGSANFKFFNSHVVSKFMLESFVKRYPEESVEYKMVQEYCAMTDTEIRRVVSPCPEGGNVICHGDCWTNNILFKQDSEEDLLPRLCFIDFQMSRFASPVLDLVYFLYTSTEKEMRDVHLDALLREYHAELQARMRALGVTDPDAIFSWDRLQAHLRSYACFGFITAAVLLPFFLAEKDEVPDWDSEFEKDPGEVKVAQLVETKNARELEKRLSDVAEEMIQRGYISGKTK